MIFAYGVISISAIVESFGIIRLECDSFCVVGDCFFVTVEVVVRNAAIVISGGILRVKLNGFGVVSDGFIGLLQMSVSDTAIVIRKSGRESLYSFNSL